MIIKLLTSQKNINSFKIINHKHKNNINKAIKFQILIPHENSQIKRLSNLYYNNPLIDFHFNIKELPSIKKKNKKDSHC